MSVTLSPGQKQCAAAPLILAATSRGRWGRGGRSQTGRGQSPDGQATAAIKKRLRGCFLVNHPVSIPVPPELRGHGGQTQGAI